MTPPDNEVLAFIKDFLWAPLLGAIGWAWHRNEAEHQAMRVAYEKLKESASQGHSTLNDKLMEHVDYRVSEAIRFARDEDSRLMEELSTQRSHIAKLFEKLEQHGQRSEDRHLETLKEIRNLSSDMHKALAQKADK